MVRRIVLLAGLLLAGAGCSTVQSLSTTGEYFGGSRADLAYLGEPENFDEKIAIFGLFDLPFSLVADTVAFPVQYFAYATTVFGRASDDRDRAGRPEEPEIVSSEPLRPSLAALALR